MAYNLIEERLISGVGLLRIPQERRWRDFIIYGQVVRKPSSEYLNFDWFPPKGLYGRACFRYQGSVAESFLLEYDRFVHRLVGDISAQNLIAINCSYAGILQSIFNLADCISECVPFSITNNVEDMKYLQTFPDELIISCQTNSAMLLQLYGQAYRECGDESLRRPSPPPPPPNVDLLPPNEPIGDVSPPYDGDDNVTRPNDIDENPPDDSVDLPSGAECQEVEIVHLWETPIDPPGNTNTRIVFGPVEDVFLREAPNGVEVVCICRGSADLRNDVCRDDLQEVQLISASFPSVDDVNFELISVTPL